MASLGRRKRREKAVAVCFERPKRRAESVPFACLQRPVPASTRAPSRHGDLPSGRAGNCRKIR